MSRSTRKALLKLTHTLRSHLPTMQWPAHPSPLVETLLKTLDLGLTCFGGPAVHFQVFHRRFVTTHAWLSEPVFQELFAVTQSLSGPASTKMLYCITLRRNGFLCALLAFFLWSLPGAAGMYALSLGVTRIGETLPEIAYAVLSGLNAATVGMIALAAVQLGEKAVTDRVSRALVLLGACAGMLYNALWYFPVIIAVSGCVTLVWDSGVVRRGVRRLRGRRREMDHDAELTAQRSQEERAVDGLTEGRVEEEERVVPAERELTVSWKLGAIVIAAFFASFIAVMVARGVVTFKPLLFALFSNMYLAGTIIFGGGPVVIPLLREYIVTEGWVSPRDFLLGLAIIQAFPGPNFNFAVYLGALAASNGGHRAIIGALIAFIGIFAPGLILVHGTMGVWKTVRSRPWWKAIIRGINASAVGLIYTAVYRLWEIGYLDASSATGLSLGREPWWVVTTAASFTVTRWFGVPVPAAILAGGVMGLIWYGVVST